VAKVPLAVHNGEQTTWHRLIFFDELAQQVATTFAKWTVVTVVGYRHQREIPLRNGATKRIEEIYAAGIQSPSTSKG